MCSARRGINLGADAGANNPTGAVDEVAVDGGTMVWILFENREITAGCAVPGLAGRDRTIRHDLLADHQVGALLGKRDDNVHVVRRCLPEQRLIYLQRLLAANVSRRAAHLLGCGVGFGDLGPKRRNWALIEEARAVNKSAQRNVRSAPGIILAATVAIYAPKPTR